MFKEAQKAAKKTKKETNRIKKAKTKEIAKNNPKRRKKGGTINKTVDLT